MTDPLLGNKELVRLGTPLDDRVRHLTAEQHDNVYSIMDDIITNLDDHAIRELMGGTTKDLDTIFDILQQETAAVISSSNKLINSAPLGYLENFTQSVEETLRCRSFNYFMLSVLPDFIMGWHNAEWGNLTQMYRLLLILAARDHGKSHQMSFAYPLWQLYRYRKFSPQDPAASKELFMAGEGMLVTNEYKLSTEFMGKVRDEIESNDVLGARLMPDSKRDGWGREKIVCKNGAKFYVRSANSKIRGLHPKWVVLDDFLNDSSLYSQEQRDRYWNIFSGVIYPALTPGGQMVIIGTPFFELDLYGTLKKANADSIAKGEKQRFGIFEYPAIFPDGTLLFETRHSYDSIMEKKALLGEIVFSREIMVQPLADGATLFPYDILRKSIIGQDEVDVVENIDSCKEKYEMIVVGCDFAISSGIGSDYSVFTIGGVDARGKIHILNTWRKRGVKYGGQIAALKMINRRFRPDVFVLETNGMQEIFLQLVEEAGLPAVGDFTGAEKKDMYKGVPALAVLFEQGGIKFPYGTQKAKDLTDLYFSELNSMTFIQDKGKLESVGQHDDTSMSLYIMMKGFKRALKSFDFNFLG
jgi:hypothetical protein